MTAATSSTSRGDAFTVREWGWIKRHTGYLPADLEDGLQGSDAELIARVRDDRVASGPARSTAGDVPQVWERFADAPASSPSGSS